jgi:hypothetical protein
MHVSIIKILKLKKKKVNDEFTISPILGNERWITTTLVTRLVPVSRDFEPTPGISRDLQPCLFKHTSVGASIS